MNKPIKNSLIIFSLFSILSCGEKSSDSEASSSLEITYEIDTVMVDVGEHFSFLNQNLSGAGLTPTKDQLYNFNTTSFEMEVYALEEMRLTELVPLEKEGPTGIGNDTYIPNLQIDHLGNTFIYHFDEILKINNDWNEVKAFRFESDQLTGDKLEDNFSINQNGIISEDGAYYFSFYGPQGFNKPREGISIVKLEGMELRKVPIPELEEITKFTITREMENNGGTMANQEDLFISTEGEYIYVSSSTFNSLYQIEVSTGKMKKVEFQSKLTRNAKNLSFSTFANSKNEFIEFHKKKIQEVSFGKLIYDDSRDYFWRFSKDPGQLGEEVVLTLFDTDLNQVLETPIKDFDYQGFSFIREGIYYRFLNIDDEMAFVRLKPTIFYE